MTKTIFFLIKALLLIWIAYLALQFIIGEPDTEKSIGNYTCKEIKESLIDNTCLMSENTTHGYSICHSLDRRQRVYTVRCLQ